MATSVTTAPQGVAVNAAVQVLASAPTLLEATTKDRKNITILNLGPNTIYVGFTDHTDASSDVTAAAINVTMAKGFPVAGNGGSLSFDVGSHTKVWAIAATAAQISPADTRVMEFV